MTATPSALQPCARLTEAERAVAQAETALRQARQDLQTALAETAAQACPFRKGDVVPIGKRRFLIVAALSMKAGPDQTWEWVLLGHQTVRVVSGAAIRENSQQSLTASAYAALPEAVRQQVLADLLRETPEDALIGEGKPLRLGSTQIAALGDLLVMRDAHALDRSPGGGRLRLESGGRIRLGAGTDYGSNPWEGLVRRGVLTLVEGTLSEPWTRWVVKAGPRLKEGYDLVTAKTPHRHGLQPWPATDAPSEAAA